MRKTIQWKKIVAGAAGIRVMRCHVYVLVHTCTLCRIDTHCNVLAGASWLAGLLRLVEIPLHQDMWHNKWKRREEQCNIALKSVICGQFYICQTSSVLNAKFRPLARCVLCFSLCLRVLACGVQWAVFSHRAMLWPVRCVLNYIQFHFRKAEWRFLHNSFKLTGAHSHTLTLLQTPITNVQWCDLNDTTKTEVLDV